ncbi:MAG: [protein-PII] uridylyltransferase [Planctomycetota bacterium]
MSSGPALSPVVLQARSMLREGREKIRRQHDEGSPGIQVCTRLADLYDEVVLEIWTAAVEPYLEDADLGGLALVAHGGFGRRDLAPYSDVDLMLVARGKSDGLASRIAASLTRDLVDAGLDTGFAIRQPREACRLAWGDPVIFSSLSEARLLSGSLRVYTQFFEYLRNGSMRRQRSVMASVVQARKEEREKWGETNYLLRPNVKRSRGGLRDIQLIRWLGFAKYGETDLVRLVKLNVLPDEDYRLLRRGYAFLLRLRNELHFLEGRSQDVLDRATQLEIANKWGYEGSEGVLPVERFMQDYFEHTRNVRYARAYFTDDTRSQSRIWQLGEQIFSRKVTPEIRMGPTHIWFVGKSRPHCAGSLPHVMKLMLLSNQHRRRISHSTWQAIRVAMLDRPAERPDEESIRLFMEILASTGRLASVLRRLHELRVLEQLIPAVKRCRGLIQFNAYHKYTVDAHCIRSVEAATDLQSQSTPMGRRYRRIKEKQLLHLALLIHDLGKGYEEDHCVVGERVAQETGELLDLDRETTETLRWLVLKHLITNESAFRHDLSDPQVVLNFAAEVGSIRRLELLIVHAVADLTAVGPGVATDWKMNLIEDLYVRTRRYFETGNLPGDHDPRLEGIRQQVHDHLEERHAGAMAQELVGELPMSLLRGDSPDRLSDVLVEVTQRFQSGGDTWASSRFDEKLSASHYTVVHRSQTMPTGTFARLAGALSSCGLMILRAQIETVGDSIVWDQFWVSDADFPGEPPDHRRRDVCQKLSFYVDHPDEAVPKQRKVWGGPAKREPDSVNLLPTKVTFDNETFDKYTIFSLFAYDQPGLLHRVAQVLTDKQLVVHFAKIDTHLDQVADVFYVTDRQSRPITDEQRQAEIRGAILEAIEAVS